MAEPIPDNDPPLFKWHGAELIFIPVMLAVGILGNALVLYITHCRWKGSIFSFFIKVLAWLDMSNLVIAMPPLLVITVDDNTPHFMAACRCTSFIAIFTAIASACVLVVIAANRFRKLCQPQRSQLKLPLAKKLTTACVVLGVVLSIPGFWIFGRDDVTYRGDLTHVSISYCFIIQDANLPLLITWAVVVGLTFVSVTASLVVLYSFTVVALRQHNDRMTMIRRPSGVSTNSKRISQKHTKVFIAVTVVFFISYSPYFITVILSIVDKSIEEGFSATGKAFVDIAKLFPLLSNAANPIIYSFTSERFREECKKVFRLRPCRKMLKMTRKDSTTNSADISQSEDS